METWRPTVSAPTTTSRPWSLLHGLTFDRRHWSPVLAEPAIAGSNRRVVGFDLPGYGESPRRDSYDQRGRPRQSGAGRSLGRRGAGDRLCRAVSGQRGGQHRRGVAGGGFGDFLRQFEPVLNSDDFLKVWETLLDGMHIHELPPSARELVRTGEHPAAGPVPGLLEGHDHHAGRAGRREQRPRPGRHRRGRRPLPLHRRQRRRTRVPRLARSRAPRRPDHRAARQRPFPHLVHPAEAAKVLADIVVSAS